MEWASPSGSVADSMRPRVSILAVLTLSCKGVPFGTKDSVSSVQLAKAVEINNRDKNVFVDVSRFFTPFRMTRAGVFRMTLLLVGIVKLPPPFCKDVL